MRTRVHTVNGLAIARCIHWKLIRKFVTLEFTLVLNAEAAMPNSPGFCRPSPLTLPSNIN